MTASTSAGPVAEAGFPVRVFGGPTAFFTYGGIRFLVDPAFDEPGDFPGEGPLLTKTAPSPTAPGDLGPVDVVLLSHDEHGDNLDVSGRALLPSAGLVLTTPSGAGRLGGNARGLADWDAYDLAEGRVRVTGVPAVHGPGSREEVEPLTGQVVGFVLTGEGLPTVYVSGDNASLDAVAEIAERVGPVDTALLFAGAPSIPARFDGAPLVLDSAGAAEATRLLDARRVVPVHYEGWSHFTEGRTDLEAAFTKAGLADRLDWGVRG
ncbi:MULTISPECIES: MBL fold metallo-hydrolase [unclassified Streptomyces]|uniref:MBL fold metallo-hydrolase n=1 Tax=unclassified Streptomyces TaxID=2593676 RepID=UPI003454E6B7